VPEGKKSPQKKARGQRHYENLKISADLLGLHNLHSLNRLPKDKQGAHKDWHMSILRCHQRRLRKDVPHLGYAPWRS